MKEEILAVRISKEHKQELAADMEEKHFKKLPHYLLAALDFYKGFDVHFLEHIQALADKVQLPLPTVIQHLLQTLIAEQAAVTDVLGVTPKIFKRSFQYDADGLVTGNRLSDLVYEQQKQAAEELLEKLQKCANTGDDVRITRDEAAMIAAIL